MFVLGWIGRREGSLALLGGEPRAVWLGAPPLIFVFRLATFIHELPPPTELPLLNSHPSSPHECFQKIAPKYSFQFLSAQTLCFN